MSNFIEPVTRVRDTQPKWAQNFFDKSVFDRLVSGRVGDLNGFSYAVAVQELAGGERKGSLPTHEQVNGLVAALQPFDPPVTLTYTAEREWEFSWETEQEKTFFLLKWS